MNDDVDAQVSVARLLERARRLWVEMAGAPVAFAAGTVDVAVSPRSLLCPPGWVGIVSLGDAVIATAPDEESARALRRALTVSSATDVAALRERLPVVDVLGPAALAYCDARHFRPAGNGGPSAPGSTHAGAANGVVGSAGFQAGNDRSPAFGSVHVGAADGVVGSAGLRARSDRSGSTPTGAVSAVRPDAVGLRAGNGGPGGATSGLWPDVVGVEALAGLRARVSPEEDGEAGLDEITSRAFVVRDEEGGVVAAAGYELWPLGTAHLSVLTDPGHRGRGLGRWAASAAVAEALAGGLLPQWRARPEASRRVRALGFHELGWQLSIRHS